MKKHLVTIALLICLVFAVAISASAAGEYTAEISVNGNKNAAVQVGDEITVTLKLRGTETSYNLFSMQDYVCFDPEFLEFVDGSIEVYTPDGGSSPLCSASALKFSSDKFDRIYISRTSLTSEEMLSDAALLTFKLKAIQDGAVEIINKKTEVFEVPGQLYSTETSGASLTIGDTETQKDPEGQEKQEDPKDPKEQKEQKDPKDPKKPSVDPSQTGGNNPFRDVKSDAYYYDAVLWAVKKGITTGTSAVTFNPTGTCSRAQMVTFLWRAAGSPKPQSKTNPFKDVAKGAYYYDAVLWANEKGITTGTSAAAFSPDKACTRGQMAAFLWRAAGSPKPSAKTNPFRDVAKSAYYYDAVLWAYGKKITTGMTADTFAPGADCSRAQMVTFLYRNQ